MKCKQCGTENNDRAIMCSSCGYVFENDGEMFLENEKTINAEASHKQSQIEEIKKRRDKKRKQKKIKKILLIVLIILITAGAIFAAFYISDKQDKKILIENELIQSENSPIPVETTEPEPTAEVTPEPTIEPIASEEVLPTEVPTVVEATEKPISTSKPVKTKNPTETLKPEIDKEIVSVEESEKPVKTKKPTSTPKPVKTTKPVKKPAMNQALVKVEKFVADDYGNHVLATINGERVYIQGMSADVDSYAVVSATDSGVKVDNIPVYNAMESKVIDSSEFIMPQSSIRLLTEADVAGLSVETLRLARNEIYARHGRVFKDDSLNVYFNAKSWYKVNPSYNYKNDVLNVTDVENKNAHFLLEVERALQ